MAAVKSRKNNRSKNTRGRNNGSSAWMWLFSGILIGLGLAYYLFSEGYIPQPEQAQPQTADSDSQTSSEAPLADDLGGRESKPEKPRYDFFTVLPEMEVVVPEQELKDSRKPAATAAPQTNAEKYLLQVGSFKQSNDAEQMKARLALMGMTARVQTVNVDGTTWHRVRVGPVTSAREADSFRQRLSNNGIESLVMKNP
jgi:cell division protein FtsN